MHPSELYFNAQQIAQAGIIPTIAYVGGRLGWPLVNGLREGHTFNEELRSTAARGLGLGLAGAGAALTYLNGGGPEVNNVVLETVGAFGGGAVLGAGLSGLKAALHTKDGVLEQAARSAQTGAVKLGTGAALTYAVASGLMGRL